MLQSSWFPNSCVNDGNAVLQWPAVWERGRRRVPLLKCQRSALKLPGAPPPVSLQDTTASATAVLQPCTGSHKGRVTPSEWGLTQGCFHSYFCGILLEIFVLTCKVRRPPSALCWAWKISDTGERKCFQSVCSLKDSQLLNGLLEALVFMVVTLLFIPHARWTWAGLALVIICACVDFQNILFDREQFPFQAEVRKHVRLLSSPSE